MDDVFRWLLEHKWTIPLVLTVLVGAVILVLSWVSTVVYDWQTAHRHQREQATGPLVPGEAVVSAIITSEPPPLARPFCPICLVNGKPAGPDAAPTVTCPKCGRGADLLVERPECIVGVIAGLHDQLQLQEGTLLVNLREWEGTGFPFTRIELIRATDADMPRLMALDTIAYQPPPPSYYWLPVRDGLALRERVSTHPPCIVYPSCRLSAASIKILDEYFKIYDRRLKLGGKIYDLKQPQSFVCGLCNNTFAAAGAVTRVYSWSPWGGIRSSRSYGNACRDCLAAAQLADEDPASLHHQLLVRAATYRQQAAVYRQAGDHPRARELQSMARRWENFAYYARKREYFPSLHDLDTRSSQNLRRQREADTRAQQIRHDQEIAHSQISAGQPLDSMLLWQALPFPTAVRTVLIHTGLNTIADVLAHLPTWLAGHYPVQMGPRRLQQLCTILQDYGLSLPPPASPLAPRYPANCPLPLDAPVDELDLGPTRHIRNILYRAGVDTIEKLLSRWPAWASGKDRPYQMGDKVAAVIEAALVSRGLLQKEKIL